MDSKKNLDVEMKYFETESFIVKDPETGTDRRLRVTWKRAFRQIIACCIVNMLMVQLGINLTFSAVLLPRLNATESGIPITKSEGSWIASLVPIFLPVGSLIVGALVDRLGRKKICLLPCAPFAIAWILNAVAENVWTIYLARALAGFSSGVCSATLVYTSEVSHPTFRGMLLNLNSVFVSAGILLTCLLGYWVAWRTMCWIFCALTIATAVMLWFVPESPHWLITFKNDKEGAAKSLKWIYGDSTLFRNEYEILISKSTNQPPLNTTQSVHRSWRQRLEEEAHLYREPMVYRPFLVLCTVFIIQQLSCSYAVIFYAVTVFERVGGRFGQDIDAFMILMYLGVIRLVVSVISSLMSKRVGRRTLLLISGVGMLAASLLGGFYVSWFSSSGENNVALVTVLGYMCMGSLGYLIVPWSLIGELLPGKVRGKLGGFMISWAYVLMFGVVKAFPYLMDAVEIDSLFYLLASVNLAGMGFVFFFLPETLGKSFAEIEEYFQPKQ